MDTLANQEPKPSSLTTIRLFFSNRLTRLAQQIGLTKFWKKSFTSKLIISFLILSLINLCSMGMIAYLDASSSIIKLSLEQLQISATAKEEALNRWLETHRKATVSLALLPEIKTEATTLLSTDNSSEELTTAYRQIQSLMSVAFASQSDVRDISILTANDGKIVFSTNSSLQGQARSADEYFLEGLKQTYIQSIYLFPNTNEPTLTISTPIFGNNDQTLGVLAINFNLESAAEIITQTNPNINDETYWVNQFQVPIYSNATHPEDLPRRLQSQGLESALNQKEGTHQELNYAGKKIIGVHSWLDQWNSVLLVERNYSQVFKPVHKLATNILFIGLGLIIILPLIIYKLARHLTQPLLTVTTAATHIARGKLRIVPVTTTDEVGRLTIALNHITRQLNHLYKSLEENTNTLQKSEVKIKETSTEKQEERQLSSSKLIPENQNLSKLKPLSPQQLHQFFDVIPFGIVVLDTEGNIYYSNSIAQGLFGPGAVPNADSDAEIYPSYIAGTEQIYPEQDLPLVRALRGETTTINDIEVHQNNQIIPIQASGTPIYDQVGNLVFAVATFQNRSEYQIT